MRSYDRFAPPTAISFFLFLCDVTAVGRRCTRHLLFPALIKWKVRQVRPRSPMLSLWTGTFILKSSSLFLPSPTGGGGGVLRSTVCTIFAPQNLVCLTLFPPISLLCCGTLATCVFGRYDPRLVRDNLSIFSPLPLLSHVRPPHPFF